MRLIAQIGVILFPQMSCMSNLVFGSLYFEDLFWVLREFKGFVHRMWEIAQHGVIWCCPDDLFGGSDHIWSCLWRVLLVYLDLVLIGRLMQEKSILLVFHLDIECDELTKNGWFVVTQNRLVIWWEVILFGLCFEGFFCFKGTGI